MQNFKRRSCLMLVLIVFLLPACSKDKEGTSGTPAPQAAAVDNNQRGQEIYTNVCSSCHKTGIAGAPVLGDKAAWQERIAKGEDQLVASALNGKGNMPPRGGQAGLDEGEIRAAVRYMVENSR
jgi:cytochrome c5